MIDRIQLLRNIGLFDSDNGAANIPLARLTIVYAENGRGKTTLAAVLRSLATGNPIPIAERRRLATQHPPHAVLACSGGASSAIFQNNVWNRTLPNMTVFDDVFVDQNVYSGLAVEPEHRQNLHELILGSHGVALNRQLQALVAQVEVHNTALRTKVAAIPSSEMGTLSVEEFCALQNRPDIDEAIQHAERSLAAARAQQDIQGTSPFGSFSLPNFDVGGIERVLQQDLPALDAAAVARVREHFTPGRAWLEAWIAQGMEFIRNRAGEIGTTCPFCAQDLAGSPVINHYRAYFSDEYAELKRGVADALADIDRTHGGIVPGNFERTVRLAGC